MPNPALTGKIRDLPPLLDSLNGDSEMADMLHHADAARERFGRKEFGVLANSVGLRWVPRKQFHDGEAYRASNMATARTLSAALGELSTNGGITFHMSAIGMAAEVQLLHSADQGSFDLGL